MEKQSVRVIKRSAPELYRIVSELYGGVYIPSVRILNCSLRGENSMELSEYLKNEPMLCMK